MLIFLKYTAYCIFIANGAGSGDNFGRGPVLKVPTFSERPLLLESIQVGLFIR